MNTVFAPTVASLSRMQAYQTAPCAADQDAGFVDPVAAVSTVDDGQLGALVGEDGHLFQRGTQGMAVTGVARKAPHADHEAFVQHGGNADLAAEFISRTRALPLDMQSPSGSCRA